MSIIPRTTGQCDYSHFLPDRKLYANSMKIPTQYYYTDDVIVNKLSVIRQLIGCLSVTGLEVQNITQYILPPMSTFQSSYRENTES